MTSLRYGAATHRARCRQTLAALLLSGMTLAVATAVAPATAHADVRARVEPRIIDELDTARLTLRVDGTSVQTLDLTALAADFEVLGTQTASQYQSVNGVVEASVEYQITLRPIRPGELTIPPIAIGDERSAPVTLEVRGIDPRLREAIDRMVFFELAVTRNPVYVRGETVLVRRLYYSGQTQIYSDLPGSPELTGALVVPIGETRSGTVIRDGERYGVIEQRFALFPERAGTLTVPPISLTSSVRLQIDGRVRRTGARVSSQALPIEVLPIPAEYPANAPWLPATAVVLTDSWSPDRTHYAVGEPLERRVEIQVDGNLAAAIAPPADALPEAHFRQYPEPAVLADDRAGPTVVGRRTTEYAMIPTRPGTVTLPDLSVTWWDVDQRQVRIARGGARELTIEGAAATADPGYAAGIQPTSSDAGAPMTEVATPTPESLAFWPPRTATLIIVVIALLGVLAAWLGAAWSWRRRVAIAARFADALERAGIQGQRRGPARALQLWKSRRQLAAAGRRRDAAGIQAALVRYLCIWYRTTPADALRQFHRTGGAAALDRLQAARFAENAGTAPEATELLAALAALRPPGPASVDPLPELFTPR